MHATQPTQSTQPMHATQPKHPTLPSPAAIPALPTIPALNRTAPLPTTPALPATAALPTTDELATVAALPTTPALATVAALPTVPALPRVSTEPAGSDSRAVMASGKRRRQDAAAATDARASANVTSRPLAASHSLKRAALMPSHSDSVGTSWKIGFWSCARCRL